MKLKKRIVLIYHKVRLFMAEMNKDQVAAFAAQSAFFLLLSLFPLAMTLLTFVKYLPFTETQVLEIIKELFPEEINSNFEFMFAEIFDSKSSLLATTATILLTVWSASKGTMAIGRGLTFMAGKEDSVNYFLRRAIHTLYTLIFCVMLVAVMVIYILGDVVVSKMLVRLDSVERFQLVDTVANILSIVKIAFAPTVLFGVMIVAYWALPVERVRIKTAVPGSCIYDHTLDAFVIWRIELYQYSGNQHIYVWKPCKCDIACTVALHVYVRHADRRGDQQIHG